MNQLTRFLTALTMFTYLCTFTVQASVLFSDTFNRTTVPNDNVDADLSGMGGTLVSNATLGVNSTWIEPTDSSSGDDHRSWIRADNGGELVVAESSAGTSHIIIDHNFIDREILPTVVSSFPWTWWKSIPTAM